MSDRWNSACCKIHCQGHKNNTDSVLFLVARNFPNHRKNQDILSLPKWAHSLVILIAFQFQPVNRHSLEYLSGKECISFSCVWNCLIISTCNFTMSYGKRPWNHPRFLVSCSEWSGSEQRSVIRWANWSQGYPLFFSESQLAIPAVTEDSTFGTGVEDPLTKGSRVNGASVSFFGFS